VVVGSHFDWLPGGVLVRTQDETAKNGLFLLEIPLLAATGIFWKPSWFIAARWGLIASFSSANEKKLHFRILASMWVSTKRTDASTLALSRGW